MKDIGEDLAGLPDGANQIPGPRVQRQVLMRSTVEKLLARCQCLSVPCSLPCQRPTSADVDSRRSLPFHCEVAGSSGVPKDATCGRGVAEREGFGVCCLVVESRPGE